jgi:hypothetical protein
LRLAGPTTDFIVGRIFEGAMSDAFDDIVKTDESGKMIADSSKWVMDKSLRSMIAQTRYVSRNCELVKE